MLFPISDETLISRALNGSQQSWVKLVTRYEKLVYNYCLRMTRNSHDAMDLMQEAFLSIYRNLPSYRGEGQFKTWMMRITANKTIDFLRHSRRHPQQSLDEMSEEERQGFPAPDSDNPYQVYAQQRHNLEIRGMMAQLVPEQRLVVELKFFQHFTFEEIAFQTGVPVNTVKSRLYAALQKLKLQLEVQHVM
ncbi:MAG: sigma-70 family RNA polymerase sigma factor [Pseudomonadales bacterium]|nr:sigma-70 family RNA polymerase sigma factor [Pseudomonadales bacterium]